MSAPLAGKFQDHYLVMGVDSKSDSETIQRAYSKLAQRYHPKNSETGDAEKFEALNVAYEVLSDPELRASFDKLKGVGQGESKPTFSGADFFEALGRESLLRSACLCVLYDRRRTKPGAPSLSMRHLENILAATTDELSTAVWYLKQRGLAIPDDKSSLQITVDGMDFLESKRPSAEQIMPFIKPSALPAPPAPTPAPAPPSPATEPESPLNVLHRALARV